MIIVKGMLEILELADRREPQSFNDFTKISIDKKRLSSATVSKRLDELLVAGAIQEIITRSKTGRRVIAYRTTIKGKRVIEHGRELENALSGLNGK
jgi:DNA-binding PadR family transcriptional regulator